VNPPGGWWSPQPPSPTAAWIILAIAGVLEIGWATGLKYSEGFTRLWPSLATLGLMAVSFLLLSHAVRTLPIGSAYAVWTGIGAVGAAIVGIVIFKEPATALRILCIAAILGGIAGLKLLG